MMILTMKTPTNFELIRSHLEYGHKVEVKWRYGGSDYIETMISFTAAGYLISEFGGGYDYYQVNKWQITSITPIPHRYKKLEVGTKVDVLDDSRVRYPFRADQVFHISGYIGKNACIRTDNIDDTLYVPLWAITPHVEEESVVLSQQCTNKWGVTESGISHDDLVEKP